MGVYLSQPKTDKVSTDEVNDLLMVGASSMQGWRNSQEDAHNSILNFDHNASFFAVYDGHGGAEVATYCAEKLPPYLKELESYKNGAFEVALQSAFLGFDKTLLEPEVVEVLKLIAGEKNLGEAEDSDALDDDEDDEDLAELREEGSLPLNEVLEKYKGGPSMPVLKKIKDGEPRASGSKPQSPFLRGRRAAAVAADAANKAEINEGEVKLAGSSNSSVAPKEDTGSKTISKSLDTKMETDDLEDDSTVSSSSSGARKTNNNNTASSVKKEAAEAEASESQKIATNGSIATTVDPSNLPTAPDSSHAKEYEQNGSVTSSVSKTCKAAPADVSTSSLSTTSPAKVKKALDDAIVSGSNDAATGNKQNGTADTEATSSTVKTPPSADRSGISSTSKESAKEKPCWADDDSTDDDADFDAEEASSNDEADAINAIEYSSEDDFGDDADDDDDDDDDDDEDEEDDDDREVILEEEDAEEALANEQFNANMIEEPGKDSGCTAVVALLNGRDLYVANAGDSRCVVCRNGKAIEMSLDHKPEDDEESARILKAGGRVTLDGRVNGGLNLSRAIGDHAYKLNTELFAEEQMISALPDIKKLIITPEDEFMVLACDGIWNYMSSEEVVDFVRLRLKDESKRISQICEELFDNCLAPNTMGDGTGCDNMTAVIVRFKPKILDLPTKINPNETEDIVLTRKASESDAADASLQKSLKRSASPTFEDKFNEAENANKNKRMKTDEKEESNTSNSSNDATSSNSSSSSSTSGTAAVTLATKAATGAEKNECDSVNTSTNEAAAAAFTST